jgi:hypothetical protein
MYFFIGAPRHNPAGSESLTSHLARLPQSH